MLKVRNHVTRTPGYLIATTRRRFVFVVQSNESGSAMAMLLLRQQRGATTASTATMRQRRQGSQQRNNNNNNNNSNNNNNRGNSILVCVVAFILVVWSVRWKQPDATGITVETMMVDAKLHKEEQRITTTRSTTTATTLLQQQNAQNDGSFNATQPMIRLSQNPRPLTVSAATSATTAINSNATAATTTPVPTSNSNSNSTPTTSHSAKSLQLWKDEKIGIVVVHCRERERMDWLVGNKIPETWNIRVYEKCGQNSTPWSTQLKNYGSEECTSYLRYIIDEFDDLPDINFFLQSDALQGRHTPFVTLEDMLHVTVPLMTTATANATANAIANATANATGARTRYPNTTDAVAKVPFLHLGPHGVYTHIVMDHGPTYYHLPEILQQLNVPFDNTTQLHWHAGACFAVRRERILARGKEYFEHLHDWMVLRLQQERGIDIRNPCWGLEASWPVVFGVSVELPKEATVVHYMGRTPFMPNITKRAAGSGGGSRVGSRGGGSGDMSNATVYR
jgi:hypothetical protein